MTQSTHLVEVVPINLQPHPNADTLSITMVGGYSVVVRTEDWKDKQLGAWIPPDNLVNTARAEFSFLNKHNVDPPPIHRVRAIRLRGELSYGMMMPAPDGMQLGENAAEYYGVVHYDPPEDDPIVGGFCAKAPYPELAKYDIDSAQRYAECFEPDELVWVTEKIHGSNARYVYAKDVDTDEYRMHVGSHSQWKAVGNNDIWWDILNRFPVIEEWCKAHPDFILYGEIYGKVQKGFNYGGDTNRFAAFDIFDVKKNRYVDPGEAKDMARETPWVPLIGVDNFNIPNLIELADGKSLMPNTDHTRKGIVVKPLVERWHRKIGRVIGKIVGETYLTKGDDSM